MLDWKKDERLRGLETRAATPFQDWELNDLSYHWTMPCTRVLNARPIPCGVLQRGRYTGYATEMGVDCPAVCDSGFTLEFVTEQIEVEYWEPGTQPGSVTKGFFQFNRSHCRPCVDSGVQIVNGSFNDGVFSQDCVFTCNTGFVPVFSSDYLCPTGVVHVPPYQCHFCPLIQCQAGEFQVDCPPDAYCVPCPAIPNGSHMEYYLPGGYQDPASCPKRCMPQYWRPDAASNCTACTTEVALACNYTVEFMRPCEEFRDAACVACSDSCDPGFYLSANCSRYSNIACEPCASAVPLNSRYIRGCTYECLPDYVPHNASYCGYCDPYRLCGVGYYVDDCNLANAFTGCSPCKNGLAVNTTVVYLTAGDAYSPYSCSWKCPDGMVLGRNASGAVDCVILPPAVAATKEQLSTPPPYCSPGTYRASTLECLPCQVNIPNEFAIFTDACRWVCVGGRIAVLDPVQGRLTCMAYEDYISIMQNTRRVLIQNPLNDTYQDHTLGNGERDLLYVSLAFVTVVVVVGTLNYFCGALR
ncbi:hypothetical protein GUITHDRAFT_147299 [Guillardia theta CCMP2712]|uniref:Uncharacterized protein n=1 Tax=Guillardia theta (strain CCMP2712) TaxID=905079 RepID=L1IDJ5_GUITC|nr:hypothetical protein GUITHDRAFT_147299 [Guillardia theta CCMP2712]EKX34321.1 hypothetical protein GUITHDRAFT_147299 [Guillardia theta CCMP2712]|eukprot:XP_005821301.1 hypothetical protein GUITHDRAFT_147299 [Guillardia theta CCMP2712]